jgi:hypothetical protein
MNTCMRMKRNFFGMLAVMATMALQAQVPPFLTNGLVAYYPFNGNAMDASGHTNNGTLLGAATFGVDRFGDVNSCLSLPGGMGVGSGVDIPSLTDMAYLPVTYSAWFFLNNFPPPLLVGQPNSWMPVVGRVQCGDQAYGVLCVYSVNGSVTNKLAYFTGGNVYVSQLVPPTNQWCQVVLTISSSGTPTFYFNGTNLPGSGAAPAGQPLDFRIGAATTGGCTNGPSYIWNGLIDDVRIYNTNLSAAEVQQLYEYEAPPCSGNVTATAVITNGFVVGATISEGGCGFTNPPSVLIEGGGGTNAAGTAVVSNGVVIDITITDAGSNYASLPNIYVGETPSITNQPQSVTVNAFGLASFNVAAFGGGLNYQWTFNGTNMPGSNFTYLLFTNVVQSNLGSYAVVVSNVFGAVTSSVAVLSMYPFITEPFDGLETLWGYTNTLDIQAWGSGPLEYQWFDNGVAIDGATNQSLTFTGIQPTNSGLYTVVVSNAFGATTNTPEQVVVEPAGVSLGLSPTVTITGVTGNTYAIQRSPNLADTNAWTTITNLTLTQPVQIWTDTNINAQLPANPLQFYRVLPGQ